jgi:hypothetical protein
MKLRLPSTCRPGCTLCAGAALSDAEGLKATLVHAERTDQVRVYVQGTDVMRHPDLAAALEAARVYLRQVAIVEEGAGLDLGGAAPSLRRMGVEYVYLSLPGAGASPDHSAWKPALAVLLALQRTGDVRVGVHLPLTPRNASQLPALLRLQRRLSVRELLISEASATDGAPAATVAAALERVWLAANAAQVHVALLGFEIARYADAAPGSPTPSCDGGLIDIIRHGVRLPSLRAGVRALGDAGRPSGLAELVHSAAELRTLGLELAARRYPFIDLPRCLGGVQLVEPSGAAARPTPFMKSSRCPSCPFDARCPGAPERVGGGELASLQSTLQPLPTWYAFERVPRVLILVSEGGDPLTYMSTLPALADALKRRGATVEIVSPWLSLWNPEVLPEHRIEGKPEWMRTREVEGWLAHHSVDDFDLVIASDFAVARVVLATRALPVSARLVVVDFHMLEGMDDVVAGWRRLAADTGHERWWPAAQLILESAFPAYLKLYLNYGVPLEHVSWRPFSLYPGHFPPGPEVHECASIFSGGDHLRDIETLRAATEQLPAAVRTVSLYAFGERLEGNSHLRHEGSTTLKSFYHALAHSRFVVLPLQEDTNRAAGITVLAMALMAGRPLVATGTAAVRDYVRHGAEALLVPPGDANALAEAITRLDTDPALLSALAAGARETARRLSTEYWADQIVSGSGSPGPAWTQHGWRNW